MMVGCCFHWIFRFELNQLRVVWLELKRDEDKKKWNSSFVPFKWIYLVWVNGYHRTLSSFLPYDTSLLKCQMGLLIKLWYSSFESLITWRLLTRQPCCLSYRNAEEAFYWLDISIDLISYCFLVLRLEGIIFSCYLLTYSIFVLLSELILPKLSFSLIGSCRTVDVLFFPPIIFLFIILVPHVNFQLVHKYPSKFASKQIQ